MAICNLGKTFPLFGSVAYFLAVGLLYFLALGGEVDFGFGVVAWV